MTEYGIDGLFFKINPKNNAIMYNESVLFTESFYLAGVKYQDEPTYSNVLRKGDLLWLSHESKNPTDEKAIAVYSGNKKIGYVPQLKNDSLYDFLCKGCKLHAKVLECYNNRPIWKRVKIHTTVFK